MAKDEELIQRLRNNQDIRQEDIESEQNILSVYSPWFKKDQNKKFK